MEEDYEKYPTLESNIPLRLEYRKIIDQTQKHGFEDPNILEESITKSDELFAQVKGVTETWYDAKLVRLNSTIVKQKTDALLASNFDTDDYVEALKTYFKKNNKYDFYIELAKKAAITTATSPSFHFMYGAFEPGIVVLTKKQRKSKGKDEQGKLEKPVVASTSEGDKQSLSDVERVFSILTKLFVKQGSSISYLEFVLNPHSFAETVENMFHVSILVKVGAARIFIDDDRHPFIEPIPGFNQQSTKAHNPPSQAIYSITMDQWECLVKKYEITRPRIPSRRKKTE